MKNDKKQSRIEDSDFRSTKNCRM